MSFEDLKAEIMLLLDEVSGPPQDAHEIYMRVRQTLDTMKAEGLPLPQDLVELEHELEARFAADQRSGSGAPPPKPE